MDRAEKSKERERREWPYKVDRGPGCVSYKGQISI